MFLNASRPAFAALSESVRYKRDSWQTWENYARAALASGHYQQGVRGLQMVSATDGRDVLQLFNECEEGTFGAGEKGLGGGDGVVC